MSDYKPNLTDVYTATVASGRVTVGKIDNNIIITLTGSYSYATWEISRDEAWHVMMGIMEAFAEGIDFDRLDEHENTT